MYDSILVPTDGSEHAQRAANHARLVASAFDATVHLLAVVDVQAAAGPFNAGGVDRDYVERLETAAEANLDDIESAVDGVSVTTAQREGDPAEAILEYVDAEGIEMVAMGTHGRTGVDRFVAGSVTEKVLRKSPVPVLTARATERSAVSGPYGDILLPTDGSDHAGVAVDHAIALGEAFDATVHVVNIVDLSTLGGTEPEPTAVIEALHDAGEAATESVAERVRDADVEVVTAVREDFPAHGLLEYADAENIDLVTMGTAGHTGLSRFLLGSTTERIVRHAEVPVLAVNAREK